MIGARTVYQRTLGERASRFAIGIAVFLLFASAAAMAYNLYDTEMQKKFVNHNLVGHREEEGFFSYITQPYQIDTPATTNIFYRWKSGSGNVYIKRGQKAGNVWTFDSAFTNWANRATAIYAAING